MFTITESDHPEIFEAILETESFEWNGEKYFHEMTGDWVSEGKYQTTDIVYFKEIDGGPRLEFYLAKYSRSGSYHSDYNYDESITFRKAKSEKVITNVWKFAE